MVNSTTCRKLHSIFEDRLRIVVPTDSTDLFETGLMDSLMLVDFISELEREFSFRLTLSELNIDSFRTIERIAEFVAGQTAKKAIEVVSYQAVS
jgi:methoxymalonate biosynthesis acyl carrier protein